MSLLKRISKYTAIALFLCITAAYAQTSTIWNASHAAVTATNRIPVDTSALGGPGYNSIGDILALVNGDCTVNVLSGQITCTKANGVSFAAVATSGSASDLSTGTLAAARIPNPSASTLGGVQAITAAGSKWINSIGLNGVPTETQPQDADLLLTDTVSNNATTSKHGFLKKLSSDAATYMDGTGNWSSPSAFTSINFTGDGTVLSSTPSAGPHMAATLANAGANTILGNSTGSSAAPAYVSINNCNTSASALQYTGGSGWGCNTAIAAPAASITGTTLASNVVTSSITTVGALASGSLTTGFTTVAAAQGGTGQTSVSSAFTSFFESVATTLGDIVYGGAAGAPTRLAGNTTTTPKFLTQTGSGSTSAAPSWTQPSCSSLSNSATGCSTATGTSGATIPLLNGANSWSGVQTIANADLRLVGTSTGYTVLNSGLASSANNTLTLPITAIDTLAGLGTAQTYTAVQSFTNGDLGMKGSSSGTMTLEAPAAASTYIQTFPATSGTVADIAFAQTWAAVQTFTNSDINILGSSTGYTTLTSGNAGSSNYVFNLPAYTGYAVTTQSSSPAQGDILYFNGTNWVDLAAGTSGNFLKTQGASANPIWAAASGGSSGGYRALSSSDTVNTADNGKLLYIASAGVDVLNLPSAASAGSMSFFVQNTATTGINTITVSPNGSENVDGANASQLILPGEVREFNCNGTAWVTDVIVPFTLNVTTTASPTLPRTGYTGFSAQLWGGGASGGAGITDEGGGGGGGAYNQFTYMGNSKLSVANLGLTLTVGAGGLSQTTTNTAGNAGGTSSVQETTNSSFFAFAYGGGAGGGGSLGAGGGGGGTGNNAAGPPNANGTPNASGTGANAVTTAAGAGGADAVQNGSSGGGSAGGTSGTFYGGGGGGNSTTKLGGFSYYGGGGGGAAAVTTGGAGGQSVWGGGGGGGGSNTTGGAGGASTHGGSGGAGGNGAGGNSGLAPAGGGGGALGTTGSGPGGIGQIILQGII